MAEAANEEIAINAAGALLNLAIGNMTNSKAIVKAGGIDPLVRMMGYTAVEAAQAKAAGALKHLAFNNNSHAECIREAGGVDALVELLSHPNEHVGGIAAAALWHLVTGEAVDGHLPNHTNQDEVRNARGIGPLCALLGSSV